MWEGGRGGEKPYNDIPLVISLKIPFNRKPHILLNINQRNMAANTSP